MVWPAQIIVSLFVFTATFSIVTVKLSILEQPNGVFDCTQYDPPFFAYMESVVAPLFQTYETCFKPVPIFTLSVLQKITFCKGECTGAGTTTTCLQKAACVPSPSSTDKLIL